MTREWGAVRRYGVAGRVQVTTVKTIHTLSPPLPHHFHCWFFPFWLIIFVESEQQLKKEFHYIFLRQSSVPLSLRPFKKKKKKTRPQHSEWKTCLLPALPYVYITALPFLFLFFVILTETRWNSFFLIDWDTSNLFFRWTKISLKIVSSIH